MKGQQNTRSVPAMSVAACTDIGGKASQQDAFFVSLDDRDGAWVIAVADGLSMPDGGDRAAQAAIGELPRKIGSREQMAAAFKQANRQVASLWEEPHPLAAPLTTLCVASWTANGGTIIAWSGDTMPFIVKNVGSGMARSDVIGAPHVGRYGGLTADLGGDTPPNVFDPEGTDRFAIKNVDTSGAGHVYAVLVASDGVWVKTLLAHRDQATVEELIWEELFGKACGTARNAEHVASSALAQAKQYGLTDNATAAAVFVSNRTAVL